MQLNFASEKGSSLLKDMSFRCFVGVVNETSDRSGVKECSEHRLFINLGMLFPRLNILLSYYHIKYHKSEKGFL